MPGLSSCVALARRARRKRRLRLRGCSKLNRDVDSINLAHLRPGSRDYRRSRPFTETSRRPTHSLESHSTAALPQAFRSRGDTTHHTHHTRARVTHGIGSIKVARIDYLITLRTQSLAVRRAVHVRRLHHHDSIRDGGVGGRYLIQAPAPLEVLHTGAGVPTSFLLMTKIWSVEIYAPSY